MREKGKEKERGTTMHAILTKILVFTHASRVTKFSSHLASKVTLVNRSMEIESHEKTSLSLVGTVNSKSLYLREPKVRLYRLS